MNDEMKAARLEKIRSGVEDFLALLELEEIFIPETGILAGTAGSARASFELEHGRRPRPGSDNYHFPMNPSFLTEGFAGIADKAEKNAAGGQSNEIDEENRVYLEAIATVYRAAADHIRKHGEKAAKLAATATSEPNRTRLETISRNCTELAGHAPKDLAQAVQLFWFAWRLRHLQGGTSTLGRLDQYFQPFYALDPDGDSALALLCEFYEKLNLSGSGDTLMNLMLGGQDAEGNDATNDMSTILLEAAIRVAKTEPHTNVRIHSRTPEAFLDKTAELQLLGHGQANVFNDDVIIPALTANGFSFRQARNYSNDGCSEIIIDGESGIDFVQMEAIKSLELAMFNGRENPSPKAEGESRRSGLALGFESGDFLEMSTFDEVFEAFLKQYLRQTDRMIDRLNRAIQTQMETGVSSIFLAGTFPQCVAQGVDPFRGGFTADIFVAFSGGIATVADALYALKKAVFDDKYCTMAEMLDALAADFKNHSSLRSRLLSESKFGNDIDEVDLIAAAIAQRFCDHVLAIRSSKGSPIFPALFDFQFGTHAALTGATSDGRLRGDPVSDHYSPTPGKAISGATAIINSAVKGPLAKAIGTSPFFIALTRGTVPAGAEGREYMKSLVKTAFQRKAAVMNIAVYDVAALKAAQAEPEKHRDLIVRVWGFSARFVELSKELQDHVILRAVNAR